MKKALSVSIITVSILFGLITIIGTLLFSFSVLEFGTNIVTILFFVLEVVLVAVFTLLCRAVAKAKQAEKETVAAFAKKQDNEKKLSDLYVALGIPPVKDANGHLMNIYDLLGIEPEYDENGVRVPTIYEILNVIPRFGDDGKEIPRVVFLKNRAKKIAGKDKLPFVVKTKFISKQAADELNKNAAAASAAVAASAANKNSQASSNSGSKSAGKGKNPKRTQKNDPMGIYSSKAKPSSQKEDFGGGLKGIFDIGARKKTVDDANNKSSEKKIEPKPTSAQQPSMPAPETPNKNNQLPNFEANGKRDPVSLTLTLPPVNATATLDLPDGNLSKEENNGTKKSDIPDTSIKIIEVNAIFNTTEEQNEKE